MKPFKGFVVNTSLMSVCARLLRILLLSLLLLQAYHLRKESIELPEAKGRREGKCGVGDKLRILF